MAKKATHRGWFGRATTAGYQFLTANRSYQQLSIAVILAASIFVLLVLGWEFILGLGPYWQSPNYDAGAHVSGWLFFKADGWHFPLFDTFRADAPDGTSIILTDSIPALALVAKLVAYIIPGNWHYFGLFVAAAYVLNAVALLWVLKQAGIRNWLGAAFAFVFACFATLHNVQFESLFAHFFVIFSLGFYIRLNRQFSPWLLAGFMAMVLLSALVHTYLFGWSVAIFAVTLITLVVRRRLDWKHGVAWLGGFTVLIAIVIFVAGHFAHKPIGWQEELYGTSSTFALDLTDPFFKQYNPNEITTYLGLGFCLLATIGAILLWQKRKELLKKHWVLALASVALLLFAITNTVYMNAEAVLYFHLPPSVMGMLEMFRASKRFIIPLYYVVAIVGLVLALRQKSKWLVAAVVAALSLQVFDTSFFVRSLHSAVRGGQLTVLNTSQWQRELTTVNAVNIFPSYACLFNYRTTPLSQQWQASMEFYQLAAAEHKISNSIRAAKRSKQCHIEAQTAHSPPAPSSLNIYLKDDNGVFMIEPPTSCVARQHGFRYGVFCRSL